MRLNRLWTWSLALAFLGSVGLPAKAQHGEDRDGFKRDVLKAVERLMDKKLKSFKTEMLKDIKNMLGHREARKPAPNALRVRGHAQPKNVKVQKEGKGFRLFGAQPKGQGRPHVYVKKGPGKQTEKDVSVITTDDGKVQVRIVSDGKVVEKEFDLDDPAWKKWAGGHFPKGFEFEIPGKGKGQMKFKAKSSRKGCSCQSSRGRESGARVKRFVERIPVEKWVKQFGEDGPGKEWIKKMLEGVPEEWLEKMKKQGKMWEKMPEGWGPNVEKVQKELKKHMRWPPEGGFKIEKVKELPKKFREHAKGWVELEELEEEKESLKKELKEIRKLLEKLMDQVKRRR
ncbi:MAG: hypothetical protein ACYTHM_13020, partial [Planctomycetota bacterium]|jgi:hypothetical protein